MAQNTAPTFVASTPVVTSLGGTDMASDVAVQADGKIVVVGSSDSQWAVVRYNPDGSLDSTFDGDGKFISNLSAVGARAESVFVQPDGKIVVAGTTWKTAYVADYDITVLRFNADGSLDPTFDSDGKVATSIGQRGDWTQAMAVQPDGKIVVIGESEYGDAYTDTIATSVVRYNLDGSLDSSFDGDGIATVLVGAPRTIPTDVVIQPDGRIVVIGYTQDAQLHAEFLAVRLNTDGTLDTTFAGDGTVTTNFDDPVNVPTGAVLQEDGKILVRGYTSSQTILARYNTDGSLDSSFDGDGKLTASGLLSSAVAVQPDGSIVLAGGTKYDANSVTAVRYHADGSLDTSFGTDGSISAAVRDAFYYPEIALQLDGGILVATSTRGATGTTDFALLRFGSDGSVDRTFAVNSLDSAPTYIYGLPPVVLDSDVRVFDAQLAAQGHYGGASLQIARHGGANPADAFVAFGLGTFAEGAPIAYSGVTVGTVTSNSAGRLVLTFNSEATQSRVNDVLQSIRYKNTTDTLPQSIQLDWLFGDGNTGGQGAGGELTTTGSTVLTLLPEDYRPAITLPPKQTMDEDSVLVLPAIVVGHPYDAAAILEVRLEVYDASLTLPTVAGLTFKEGDGIADETMTFFGSQSSLQAALNGVLVTPDSDVDRDSFLYILAREAAAPDRYTSLNLGIVINDSNDAPTLSITAAGEPAPHYVEGGGPVALMPTAALHDADLATRGYGGATFTISRAGGATGHDLFSQGTSALAEGSWVMINGNGIAKVTRNSHGELVLTFVDYHREASANAVLRSLHYANSSETPSDSVQLDWTFSDGNTGAQGPGGALTVSGSITVQITGDGLNFMVDPNGDIVSDLLWRAADGTVAAWEMNGTSFTGCLLNAVPSDWLIIDAHGGYNGDGRSDLLWRNSDGTVATWELDSGTVAGHVLATVATSWNVIDAHGDYDGDGKADVLWRDSDGTVATWQMKGGASFSGQLFALVPTDWSIITAHADYNGDGRSDILWRSSDGTVATWEMNGSQMTGRVLSQVPLSWTIVDAQGDYNGDGKADVLWRNDDGTIATWEMNGAQVTGHVLSVVPASWALIDGHGDYNGDGYSDLLWRGADGTVAIWQMNGAQFSGQVLGSVPNHWTLMDGHDDYNGDGRSDLLWRGSDGTVATWEMNGAQFTSHILARVPANWSLVDVAELAASLNGTAATDTLSGTVGRDTLYGAVGDDRLSGGPGSDVFVYRAANDAGPAGDIVTDFSKAEGDVLNLRELLQSFAGYNGTNAFSGGYLAFASSGSDTAVQIDSDGGANAFVTLATLRNVSLEIADTSSYVV